MMERSRDQTDVVVVGAGPSGLFAAAELARHGVATRVLERSVVPHRQARATAIQPGTLELLVRAGIADRFCERSVHVRGARLCGPDLKQVAEMSFDGLDCYRAFQCSLPQSLTEEILTEHLVSLGGRIERGVTVTSVDASSDGLVVGMETSDGQRGSLRARFVIGAGGAASVTRHAMTEELEGETYEGTFVVADIRADLPFDRDTSWLVGGPDGFALVAPLPAGHWILFMNADEASSGAEPSPPEVEAALSRRLGRQVRVAEQSWAAIFRMHRRIAPRLADGGRFLVGDAGHLSSPFGGEGLNSGLHDAADLAWKLALVLRGNADPTLLDSYAIERTLADQHVLAVSDRLHGAVMSFVDAWAGGESPTPPASDPDAARELQRAHAMIDVSYAGSPLVLADEDETPVAPGPGERYPDRARLSGTSHHLLVFGRRAERASDPELEAFTRTWRGLVEVVDAKADGLDRRRAGLPEGGVALIRPDGYVSARTHGPAIELASIDAHLRAYLTPA